MSIRKIVHSLGILLFCIILNLGGRYLASVLKLPVWLDMTGTCVACYYLGLPGGILIAILNNVIFSFISDSAFIYVFTSVVCALVMYLCIKKGYMSKLSNAMFMSFWIGLSSVVISTPLNLIFYNGYSGNIWGDALVDMLRWYGGSRYTSALLGEIVIEVLDKQLCIFLSIITIRIIRKVTKGKLSKYISIKGLVGLIIFCLLVTSFALKPNYVQAEEEKDQSEYTSRIFNNQNGLMSSDANVIEETEDGYIWIGSYAGLTRFDGTEFEFIREGGIVNVTSMLCDSQGRLWIGTNDSGIACYQDEKFTFYKTENGLPAESIRNFCEGSSGEIYVATTDRVCVFEPDGSLRILNNSLYYVQAMTIYKDTLVCVTNDGSIYALSNGTITASYNSENKKNFFNCVKTTTNGLMAGTSDNEIYSLNIIEKDILLENKIELPLQNIHFIQDAKDGDIWICGDNGFGYEHNGQFHKWNIPEFSASIEWVHEDYQGNVWVASSRYGVLCLSRTPFYNLFSGNGIDSAICNAVIPYQNGFLVGTDNGLICIDQAGIKVKNELTKLLLNDRIRSLMTDSKGNIWICSYGNFGLVEMKPDGELISYNSIDYPELPSNRTRCITELTDGTIAVGTADGIYFIRDGDVEGTISLEDGLLNTQILSLVQGNDGILYAGSDGAGVFMIKNQKLVGNITKKDGLSSDVILRTIRCDYGILLVTSNSLCLLDGKINILTNFPYYNNFDILINNTEAYVLSSAGIFMTDLKSLCKNEEASYTLYDANHGLQSSITANSWNYIDKNQYMYICCNDGIVSFNIKATEDKKYRYGIKSVLCDGEPIALEGNKAIIPKTTKEISISGSLRNYALTDVKIRFFVENMNDNVDLISCDNLTPIRIYNPVSGNYVVHFQVYDASGNVMLEEQVYTLVKEKQMWEHKWFKFYFYFMIMEILSYIIWTFVLVLDDRRKNKMLAEMRGRKERELVLSQTVVALAKTVDAKDHYTSGHSERVGKYAKMLAARMGKSPDEQERIYRTGLLHDVGKIRIPEAVINKPGRLNDEELRIIMLHPIAGYQILREISADASLSYGARYHHERYDGKGYPNGLAGEQIPEIARIICVADAYDAMTSNRSYRLALTQEVVKKEIEKGKGTQFDPVIADIMLQIIDEDKEYVLNQTRSVQKKILIVDNNQEDVALVRKILSDKKLYVLKEANSLQDAIAILKQEKFDLVVLDNDMFEAQENYWSDITEDICDLNILLIMKDKRSLNMEGIKGINIVDWVIRPINPYVLKEIFYSVLAE